MSDLNSWWLDHINLSSDRGYPSPEQAARAAWEHQQAKVKELEGDVTHLTACQSELIRQREELTKLVASLEEVRAQEYAFKQAEVDKLTGAIQKWLDGDYPNPRRNRPHDCAHGVGYWQSCDNCETEYWESVLKQDGE